MSTPFIEPQDLAARLGQPGLSVVDASWYLPQMNRDAKAEFAEGHIPGAVYFDLDAIADASTDLPHMVANTEMFEQAVGQLGISDTDLIVIYDGAGLFSAARVWWNFRMMGATNVRVLNGGLPKWKELGLPVTSDTPAPIDAKFQARPHAGLAASSSYVLNALETGSHQVVDVRPAPRFAGVAPEPRAGLRSGHMQGAKNLPFGAFVRDGQLVGDDELESLLANAGIDPSQPLISSCGSGVTAPLLNLALAKLGYESLVVYDGSWTEWGGRDDLPVVTD